jgi:two-component system LytT family response regulator
MINALPQPSRSDNHRPSPDGPRAIPMHQQDKPAAHTNQGKIMLPTMDGLCFEKVKHIAYLEASGNYTVLHFTDGRQVLVCKTLGDVEQMLPADAFVRIHRSHTIHLRHIKKYTRGKGGHVLLQNGVTLAVSSGQREVFLSILRQFFGY